MFYFALRKEDAAGATGGQFQPVLTWSDCQRNNYATIRYAILAIPGPQWLEVQVPTRVRRVMDVLVRRIRTHGRFLGWQTSEQSFFPLSALPLRFYRWPCLTQHDPASLSLSLSHSLTLSLSLYFTLFFFLLLFGPSRPLLCAQLEFLK